MKEILGKAKADPLRGLFGVTMDGKPAIVEYKTVDRLKKDFWLYVVFNCATQSEIHIIQDPVRLGWKPIVQVEHYHVSAGEILKNETAMT